MQEETMFTPIKTFLNNLQKNPIGASLFGVPSPSADTASQGNENEVHTINSTINEMETNKIEAEVTDLQFETSSLNENTEDDEMNLQSDVIEEENPIEIIITGKLSDDETETSQEPQDYALETELVVPVEPLCNTNSTTSDEIEIENKSIEVIDAPTNTLIEETVEGRSDGSDSGIGLEGSSIAIIANLNDSVPSSSLNASTSSVKSKGSLKRRSDCELPMDGKKPKRNISFDTVTVYYFSRIQGFACVPSQGGCTLGMSSQHFHKRQFSLSEHAVEQKRLHRQQLQEQQPRVSSSDETDSDEEPSDSGSDVESESTGFLQPVPVRQRRALLKAAGVRKIDPTEKDDCGAIRNSREFCGCNCRGYCDPETCFCGLSGIKCQVDRPSFPCGCTHDGCANVIGRVEFNPGRVRTHYYHTIMRLQLENKEGQYSNTAIPNNNSYATSNSLLTSTYNQDNWLSEMGDPNYRTCSMYNTSTMDCVNSMNPFVNRPLSTTEETGAIPDRPLTTLPYQLMYNYSKPEYPNNSDAVHTDRTIESDGMSAYDEHTTFYKKLSFTPYENILTSVEPFAKDSTELSTDCLPIEPPRTIFNYQSSHNTDSYNSTLSSNDQNDYGKANCSSTATSAITSFHSAFEVFCSQSFPSTSKKSPETLETVVLHTEEKKTEPDPLPEPEPEPKLEQEQDESSTANDNNFVNLSTLDSNSPRHDVINNLLEYNRSAVISETKCLDSSEFLKDSIGLCESTSLLNKLEHDKSSSDISVTDSFISCDSELPTNEVNVDKVQVENSTATVKLEDTEPDSIDKDTESRTTISTSTDGEVNDNLQTILKDSIVETVSA